MQKKVSAAVRAFGRAHKAGLALLGGGAAALGVFWAARRSAAAMQWWVEYVSMPVKRFASALVEPLPFSFCELAATAAILICLVRLVQRIVRAMHRKQAGFAAWVLHVGTAAVWIYDGVCALWGTQYYAPSFAAQANMQAPALSVEQLAAAEGVQRGNWPLVTSCNGKAPARSSRAAQEWYQPRQCRRTLPAFASLSGRVPRPLLHQCSFDKRTISPNARPVKWGMEEGKEPISAQHLEERAPHVVQVLKPDRGGKAEHGVLPILKDGDTPVPLQPVQHPAGVLAGEAGGNGAGRLIHPRHSGPAGAEVLQPGLQVPGQAGHPGPVTRGGSGPGQIHPPHSLVSIGVLTTYSR